MDLTSFAEAVGDRDPVAIAGFGTRAAVNAHAPCVAAPAGIDWIRAEEMTIQCGAGTAVDDVEAALAEVGQTLGFPPRGTIGGALAVGRSDVRRLEQGPIRDRLLQARYVDAAGRVVKAGGPTVKNVTGFDLCRLLVGSWGTLGFIGEVILRTRPLPRDERWFVSAIDPFELLAGLYRPQAILWDGEQTWVLLAGHPDDIAAQASRWQLRDSPPPDLPRGGRWSLPPAELAEFVVAASGRVVAEVGVGVVHHSEPQPRRSVDPAIATLHARIKHEFDPTGRLNPGLDVLDVA